MRGGRRWGGWGGEDADGWEGGKAFKGEDLGYASMDAEVAIRINHGKVVDYTSNGWAGVEFMSEEGGKAMLLGNALSECGKAGVECVGDEEVGLCLVSSEWEEA
jgi:hypothetical protein